MITTKPMKLKKKWLSYKMVYDWQFAILHGTEASLKWVSVGGNP